MAKKYFLGKIYFVTKREHPNTVPDSLVESANKRGWRISQKGDQALLRKGRTVFRCAVQRSREAKRETLLGAFAVAILRAQQPGPGEPLAVLWAPHISDRTARELGGFIEVHAPNTGWGLIDDRGRIDLRVDGLAELNRAASPPIRLDRTGAGELFSDLNQWLLKVLLAPHFPARLLRAERRGPIRNATVLAELADVSLPVSARLVQRLEHDGFLERRTGLELVRIPELLERWRNSAARVAREEFPARLRVPEHLGHKVLAIERESAPDVRIAFGLFAAAEQLTVKHVTGAPQHLYVERVTPAFLQEHGIIRLRQGEVGDFVVRIPRTPETVFRGWVRSTLEEDSEIVLPPATDILQTWMDVSHHPARGEELARFIWEHHIAPCVEER